MKYFIPAIFGFIFTVLIYIAIPNRFKDIQDEIVLTVMFILLILTIWIAW